MKILPDTHILLWAKTAPARLSRICRELLEHPDTEHVFSAVSIWEVAVKTGLGQAGFNTDPRVLYHQLRDDGYKELVITSVHTFGVGSLPKIHKDPFDRILIAQANHEGCLLLTADPTIAKYPGPIRLV